MKRKGLLPALSLSVLLALGFALVWLVFATWISDAVVAAVESARVRERLYFLADGTPLIRGEPVGDTGMAVFRDLEGNPQPPPKESGPETDWRDGRPLVAAISDELPPGGMAWSHRLRSTHDDGTPPTIWYCLVDDPAAGSAYFIGYDSQAKTRLGYLGTAGFRHEPPPPAERIPLYRGDRLEHVLNGQQIAAYRFGGRGYSTVMAQGPTPPDSLCQWDILLVGRDHRIYHADLRHRTMAVFLEEAGMRSAMLVWGLHDPVHGTPQYLAVRTEEAVRVFDKHGTELRRHTIPAGLRDQDFLFLETADGGAIMYARSPYDDIAETIDYRIAWVDAHGNVREAAAELAADGSQRTFRILGGVTVPAPLMLAGYCATNRAQQLLAQKLADDYRAACGRAWTEFLPALAIAQLVGAGFAWLCYRRQVRYGAGRRERIAWPLFVLAFGLPGWIGYRFGRSWPLLETCPQCAADVPRDRDECCRCEMEFPRPALKGTEVFA